MYIYRGIPNYTATIHQSLADDEAPCCVNHSTDNHVLETELYRLGCTNFYHNKPYYRVTDYDETKEYYANGEYKHFFLFIDDAIKNTFYCLDRRYYGDYSISIVEYDIPSEILLPYIGFGLYQYKNCVEFSLPKSVIVSKEVDLPIETINESCTYEHQAYLETIKDDYTRDYVDRCYRYNQDYRLQDRGNIYESPYITGRYIHIKKREILFGYPILNGFSHYTRKHNIALSPKNKFIKWRLSYNHDTLAQYAKAYLTYLAQFYCF